MAQSFETLVFLHRLKASETEAVFAHDAVFPTSGLKAKLLQAVEDACVDRLLRAAGCLDMARRLMTLDGDEETQRTGIGRAYYSIHHSLRAIALWQNKWDPDGHEETIQELRRLLKSKAFRDRSGLAEDSYDQIIEARTNRHIADYSPYEVQRDPPRVAWIGITKGRWAEAAGYNLSLADTVFEAGMRFVGS